MLKIVLKNLWFFHFTASFEAFAEIAIIDLGEILSPAITECKRFLLHNFLFTNQTKIPIYGDFCHF